jgi:hypothetical protein
MRRTIIWIFAVLAVAQVTAAQTQAADIHGIKIKDSGFDGATKTVSLTFINDRAADITAYNYCIVTTDPTSQTFDQCSVVDAMTLVLYEQAARRLRPWLNFKSICDECSFVHPGEERQIKQGVGYTNTIRASIRIDSVAWSDDTFEGNAQPIITERTAELKEREFVSKTVRKALSNGPLMVESAIADLQQEQKEADKDRCTDCASKRLGVIVNAIRDLQQPKRYLGNTKEYVPDNQSEFLEQFLVRHEALSAEHAKHVSLRKADQQ